MTDREWTLCMRLIGGVIGIIPFVLMWAFYGISWQGPVFGFLGAVAFILLLHLIERDR